MSRRLVPAVCAALLLSAGCAWSNPDNRPVWNAFERSVVPDEDGLFYAALPVTVPLGLVAIVVDTLVAHPIQVLDDAYGDAADLWRDGAVDFENHYYTELGFAIPRAVATPVTFGFSFAGRALFDIPPRRSEEERERLAREREQQQRERLQLRQRQLRDRFVAWLRSGCDASAGMPAPTSWSDDFDGALRHAMAGDARTREQLHRGMLAAGHVEFGPYRAEAGLLDEDPVVRYATLGAWPAEPEPSPATLGRLHDDPVESVRLLAQRRFPK